MKVPCPVCPSQGPGVPGPTTPAPDPPPRSSAASAPLVPNSLPRWPVPQAHLVPRSPGLGSSVSPAHVAPRPRRSPSHRAPPPGACPRAGSRSHFRRPWRGESAVRACMECCVRAVGGLGSPGARARFPRRNRGAESTSGLAGCPARAWRLGDSGHFRREASRWRRSDERAESCRGLWVVGRARSPAGGEEGAAR